jgi:hypothetical protein
MSAVIPCERGLKRRSARADQHRKDKPDARGKAVSRRFSGCSKILRLHKRLSFIAFEYGIDKRTLIWWFAAALDVQSQSIQPRIRGGSERSKVSGGTSTSTTSFNQGSREVEAKAYLRKRGASSAFFLQ